MRQTLDFYNILCHDKKMKYFLCLVPFLLTACSAQLQQSSQAWDSDAPTRVSQRQLPRWQTPADNGASPTQKPVRTADKAQASPEEQPRLPERSAPLKRSQGTVGLPELRDFAQAPTERFSGASGDILGAAEQFLGVPYVYGGHSPDKGFDCSGLVFYIFQQQGISIQRTADKQFLQGQEVALSDLQAGDLVFFSHSGKFVDHVGIYAGNDLFIHAPRTGRTVSYDSLKTGYYQSHFRGAKRFL